MSTPAPTPLALVLLGCVLMFAVLEFGTQWLMQWLDQPTSAILATVAMLALGLALMRSAFGRTIAGAFDALGFRTPTGGAVAVAAILVVLMLAFFPVFGAATGATIRLKPDWLWLLAGAVALNGIAEEALFRGYVFGGLRRAGYGFVAAAAISMAIFAAVHLFLFVRNPFIVGLLGTMVAVAIAFPLAHLFERGNNSLWPPALVHTATHTIRFVEVSEPYATTAMIAWLCLQVVAPFAIFVLGRRLLRAR